jgi:hypothetical protein
MILPDGRISRRLRATKSHGLGGRHRSREDDQPAQNSANVSAMVITIIKWMLVTSLVASGARESHCL